MVTLFLLSTFFLVFNTFSRAQIETNSCFLCLHEAALWLRYSHFYSLALQSQSLYHAV
ncbi:hypothetical protein HMPREF0971_00610 [Segatella oris F0302]|uniref:Uncharacterized protein n=1 Tax=Segatella oris F0302 TaxID=649760 RepID=D1QNV9_9BACT|nr:hypothetical protein HMPREF0971_00610 [Segatella oris F0302]